MNKDLKAFNNDFEVPEKVRDGVEDTLASIRKEQVELMEYNSNTEHDQNHGGRRYLHFFKSQAAAAACVAVLAATGITAVAAGYHLWSRGIEHSLQATDSQKAEAESTGLADNPEASDGSTISVVHDGIMVSVEQTVVDNYRAVIALKIHGLEIGDEDPAVGTVACDIDGTDSNWAGGFEDGTDENGDYEFDIYFDNDGGAGALIGKTIQVTFGDLGSGSESSENYKAAYPGEWNLSWTLQGSSEIRKIDLDQKIGNTEATVKSVEISPISARITMDWPYQEITESGIDEDGNTIESKTIKEAPTVSALLMKDGTVNMKAIEGTTVAGYTDDNHKTYVAQVNFQSIIDPDEVSELLFATDELGEKAAKAEEDGTLDQFSNSLTADDFDRVALK